MGEMEQLERVLVKVFLRNENPLSILRFTDAKV